MLNTFLAPSYDNGNRETAIRVFGCGTKKKIVQAVLEAGEPSTVRGMLEVPT